MFCSVVVGICLHKLVAIFLSLICINVGLNECFLFWKSKRICKLIDINIHLFFIYFTFIIGCDYYYVLSWSNYEKMCLQWSLFEWWAILMMKKILKQCEFFNRTSHTWYVLVDLLKLFDFKNFCVSIGRAIKNCNMCYIVRIRTFWFLLSTIYFSFVSLDRINRFLYSIYFKLN